MSFPIQMNLCFYDSLSTYCWCWHQTGRIWKDWGSLFTSFASQWLNSSPLLRDVCHQDSSDQVSQRDSRGPKSKSLVISPVPRPCIDPLNLVGSSKPFSLTDSIEKRNYLCTKTSSSCSEGSIVLHDTCCSALDRIIGMLSIRTICGL